MQGESSSGGVGFRGAKEEPGLDDSAEIKGVNVSTGE